MPEISRFFGIVISMYFRDHSPPHFHAAYGEYTAQVTIEDLRVIHGELPRRVKSLVLEWANDHRDELMKTWNAIRDRIPYNKIEPLQP
ncbi:MAG TPA: DUF4160 domain-containing protein [Candidatus Kapabacteria bacterium]|jgi:hypothetical protein|nr:DUF4160 domain-containing protein [Candidatus Kapabacteria bacterium]